MAKEYLQSNGKLLMTPNGELVQVPDSENLNDLADTNGVMATQSEEVTKEIEELIVKNGVIDGSPREVFTTVTSLKSTYPDGAPGVYLTKNDGHWYYWNGIAWTDGGVYQAIEVPSEVTEAVNNINGLLYGEILLDRVEYANNAYRDSEDNLITTYYASKSALSQANKEIANLKEVLYGYVLDSTDVEINSVIPYTTTIGSNTYNLVDNVYGLIKEVRGNTIKSENLLILEDKAETTTSGITYSIKDGVITLNGTATATINLRIMLVYAIPVGTYYKKTFNDGYYQLTSSSDVVVISSDGSYTTEVAIKYVYKYISSGATFTNATIKPMLVKGSTAPTEFKQGFNGLKSVTYNGLNIVGANLLNIADETETTTNGITYSIKNGVITLNGTATTSVRIKLLCNLKANETYYIKLFNAPMSLRMYYSSDVTTNFGTLIAHSKEASFTPSTDVACINIFPWTNDKFNNDNIYPMLVKGSTAPTTFKPYREPTTILPFNTILRGLGSAKDKIVITKNEDNDYYTATKITNISEEITINGVNESNASVTKNDDNTSYRYTFNVSNSKGMNCRILSSLLQKVTFTDLTLGNEGIAMYSANRCSICIKGITTLSEYQTYLQANPITLVYELATLTTEVLSTTLTDSDVMPLLELGGSIEVGETGVKGSTIVEMVYRLSNTGV